MRAAVLSASALALAIYVLGPLDRARWSIVDDHEIVHFAGASGRLAFADIPRALQQTEVGYASYMPRFRPSYFVLRLVETSLWGTSPQRWYRARMALYAVSVFLLGWLIAARIGIVATVGFLVWVLSARYWFDVWRLGAAEAYGVFGGALWGFGIHLLWPASPPGERASRWRLGLGLLLFVVGNAVVVGAKETFVIIAVPNLLLAFWEMWSGRGGGVRWWTCVLGVLAAVAEVSPLVVFFSRTAIDTYGRSVAPQARLTVLGDAALKLTALHLAFVVASTLWIAVRLAARWSALRTGTAVRRLTSGLALVSAAALALYLSQIVLYNGEITPDTRYEFPAALALPGLLVAVSLCLHRFFRSAGFPGAERAVLYSTAAVFLGLALLAGPGLRDQREHSRGWANTTREFTARVRAAAAAARAAPDVPIVVVSGRPLDMEPILSIERFLRALGAVNLRFLVLDWQSLRPQWSPLEGHLAPGIEQWARHGGLGYEPIARLRPEGRCFTIGLSSPPLQTCQDLARF